jgi:putative transposase
MGYRNHSSNIYTVALVELKRLPEYQKAFCKAIRQEAGRCWTDMVNAHVESRSTDKWLDDVALQKLYKGKYSLHSTTIQGLAQKLGANILTAKDLRKDQANNGEEISAKYPYHTKEFQTPIWKESAIHWNRDGHLELSNGKNMTALSLIVPDCYYGLDICKAELTWDGSNYILCLTIDSGHKMEEPIQNGLIAGLDLGEINIAAIATENGDGVVINGRLLRSIQRRREKKLAAYNSLLSYCTPGSKRYGKLVRSKKRICAKVDKQKRDILHKASRQAVNFCYERGVSQIAVGDVRDIADEVNLGHKTNQKISQWTHGQFSQYLIYKAQWLGMNVELIPEDYSSRTCSNCRFVKSYAPKGRVYTCPGCGAVVHRDLNGAANICSRAKYNSYGKVQISTEMYLRPTGRSRVWDTDQSGLLR